MKFIDMNLCAIIGSEIFVIVVCFVSGLQGFVESAAGTDWSLNTPEEYVTAYINLTYMTEEKGVEKLYTEKTEIGRYGIGKVAPASGAVVHIMNGKRAGSIEHHGCDEKYINEKDIPKSEAWIALIERGQCSYDKKLEVAWRHGASAILVYDKEDNQELRKMKLDKCIACDIPGVFTYRKKGQQIANLTQNGSKIHMYITVGERFSSPYNGINRTSVLFVSISFIVLMIISMAWLVFYYVQRFRYLHAKDRLAQRLCNAAKKALAKIPTRNLKTTDKELTGEGECCAVCIEPYRTGDTLRILPCRHEFHKGCVDPWLLDHRTCPMCKMDILKYYGYVDMQQFAGSQESIIHVDFDDGMLNAPESRDTESPIQEMEHTIHEHSVIINQLPQSSSTYRSGILHEMLDARCKRNEQEVEKSDDISRSHHLDGMEGRCCKDTNCDGSGRRKSGDSIDSRSKSSNGKCKVAYGRHPMCHIDHDEITNYKIRNLSRPQSAESLSQDVSTGVTSNESLIGGHRIDDSKLVLEKEKSGGSLFLVDVSSPSAHSPPYNSQQGNENMEDISKISTAVEKGAEEDYTTSSLPKQGEHLTSPTRSSTDDDE